MYCSKLEPGSFQDDRIQIDATHLLGRSGTTPTFTVPQRSKSQVECQEHWLLSGELVNPMAIWQLSPRLPLQRKVTGKKYSSYNSLFLDQTGNCQTLVARLTNEQAIMNGDDPNGVNQVPALVGTVSARSRMDLHRRARWDGGLAAGHH